MFDLGIEDIARWSPTPGIEIKCILFACGCEMNLYPETGEMVDTLHAMCEYHLTGELDS